MNTPIAAPTEANPFRFWTARDTVFAFGAVTLAWLAFVARWWIADAVVPWDSKNHFFPMLRFLGEWIRAGEWPLWNPYHFSGFPTVADPQSMLFSPTMLLFALLDPAPSLRTFDLVVFLHLLAGAFGILGLFRFRGWHPAGAVLAALVYAFGGSAAMRLQHTGMIVSYGLFPLALLTLEVALARRSILLAALFGCVAAPMALGRDQVAFLFCIVLIALVLVRIATAERPLRYLASRLPVLLVMGVVGLALIAVPSLLTLQLLASSNRPEIGFAVAVRAGLYPVNLATLLAPDLFGAFSEPYRYWGPSHLTTGGDNLTDPPVNQIFAGSLAAVLILWHGLAGRRAFDRAILFWTAAATFALFYALGRATPVFEFFFDWLPGVKLYRRPADATFLFNVSLAMLAGYLAHRWVVDGAPRVGRIGAVAVLAGSGALLAAALAFAVRSGHFSASLPDAAVAAVLVLASGVLLTRAVPSRLRPALVAGAVLLTAGEFVARHAASPLNAEPRSNYVFLEEPRMADQRALDVLDTELERRHASGQRPRVEFVGVPAPWMNGTMVFGFESTLGYNPLRLEAYQRAVGPGENSTDVNLRTFPRTFRSYRSTLARLLGVEYLVTGRPIDRLPRHFPRVQAAERLFAGDQAYVYRLPGAAPRAYFAGRVRVIDADALLLRGDLPPVDVGREAVIDDETLPRRVYGNSDTPFRSQVSITEYLPNEVRISVENERGGVLVLHDLFYPGWVAEVDGRRRPILRANFLFRGVELPPGRHEVVFRFQPLSAENLVVAARTLLGRRAPGQAEPDEEETVPAAPVERQEIAPQAPATPPSDRIASLSRGGASGTRAP